MKFSLNDIKNLFDKIYFNQNKRLTYANSITEPFTNEIKLKLQYGSNTNNNELSKRDNEGYGFVSKLLNYNQPPNCNSWERRISLSGYTGSICSPKCNGQASSCNYQLNQDISAMQTCAAMTGDQVDGNCVLVC